MAFFRQTLCAAAALLAGIGAASAAEPARGLDKIEHIVVIYLENRSFDNLFGLFPGAAGIAESAQTAAPQVDRDGKPYATLPQPLDTTKKPAVADTRFPADLPNRPFGIGRFAPLNAKTGDLVHRYYQNIEQIDGGKNDKFVAWSDAGGLTMGYYDGSKTRLWQWAKRFTLTDHFFMGGFGGSFLNHILLACACVPKNDAAPDSMKAQLDAAGHLVKDGAYRPDGYAVNTIQPFAIPYDPKAADPAKRLPPQELPTIGDRLSAKGVSWAWYSGGFKAASEGRNEGEFQYHHQPYVYFKNYGEGTEGRRIHLKDAEDLYADVIAGKLPAVTFYKPVGVLNQHPGYAEIDSGDRHVDDLLKLIEKSPQWKSTAVIITYDENGGTYDHVAPPKGDQWGPATRIPTLVISPYARKHTVDHTVYDTMSILKLIENRFGLEPLTDRDAKATSLEGAFKF